LIDPSISFPSSTDDQFFQKNLLNFWSLFLQSNIILFSKRLHQAIIVPIPKYLNEVHSISRLDTIFICKAKNFWV